MLILIAVAVVALLAFLLWGSLSALKRRRLLEDLPTSKTAGVFIGLVELKGTAESENPYKSFLAENRCVWFSWTVQEHWSRTVTETCLDSDGKTKTRTRTESGWTTVAAGGDASTFYLKDDLGVIRIDPNKAEIHATNIFHTTVSESHPMYYGKGPVCGVMNSTGRRCFSEEAISLHQPIYVVGPSRERTDCVAAEIAHHDAAAMFMISTSTEESHRHWGLWKFWCLGIFAVLVAVGIAIALVQGANDEKIVFGVPLIAGLGMLTIWGTGWLWMVYNSLVGLKNRVKMAAANINVELKRRFELIPQLLSVVEGMRHHEKDVQQTLVRLRNQSAIVSVERAEENDAPAPQGCAKSLTALVESYPELKSNETFMKLHKNLVETEQRIALARNYYNDVIETYNNRRERFPECLIAVMADMHPIPFFQAEDFERARIEVHLVE